MFNNDINHMKLADARLSLIRFCLFVCVPIYQYLSQYSLKQIFALHTTYVMFFKFVLCCVDHSKCDWFDVGKINEASD